MSTFRHNYDITLDGVAVVSNQESVSGDSVLKVGPATAAAESTTEFEFNVDEDALTVLFLHSSVDASVKTNSASVPQETISLVANVPLIWTSDSASAKPLSDDVTALHVVIAGTTAASFTAIAITDPTA